MDRALALRATATRIRVSELPAVRWSDVDFENPDFGVNRTIRSQVADDRKIEASERPVPLDSCMAEYP